MSDLNLIHHKFRDHKISRDTKYLIIGTLNPDIDNERNNADFFYSRKVKRHNHMWSILPRVFLTEGYSDLTGADKAIKLAFMARTGVDFVDIVDSVSIPKGSESNFKDSFIDKCRPNLRNVILEIEGIAPIAVCFSRKTPNGIPNISKGVREVQEYCENRNIPFKWLPSPSPRHGIESKIKEWGDFFLNPRP